MDNKTHKATDKLETRANRARRQQQRLSNRSAEETPAESFQRVSNFTASHGDILALQRTIGNRAVRRMLKEGSPAKPVAQLAAGFVQIKGEDIENVQQPTIAAAQNIITNSAWLGSRPQENGLLQRQCACETPTIGGNECKECRQKLETGFLQRAAVINVPDNFETRAPVETQAFPKSSLIPGFNKVRVHADMRAVETAQDKRLPAHGLTHVVQRTLTVTGLHRPKRVIQREPSYDECTPAQEKIVKKSHDHAMKMMITAMSKLYAYDGTNPADVKKALKRRFDTTSRLFALWAAGKFLQIMIQSGSPQYECEAETEGRGWSVWCVPFSDIELRKNWFADPSIKGRARTMIHEWFHRYGCHLDLGYHTKSEGAGHGTARSILNADSWARFAADVN